MTIEKIQNSKIITFKPKTPKVNLAQVGDFISISEQKEKDKVPNNPYYYQTINKINRQNHFIAITKGNSEIKLQIPFENNDSITLELDESDSSNLLLKQDGSLDDESVDFFVEYFKSFYKIRKDKYKKEKSYLETILKENSNKNVISLNSRLNLEHALVKNLSVPPEDYMEALFADILDSETRYTLAKLYLKAIEENFAKSTLIVAKETMELLRQCKQKDGSLDKSNLGEKTKIAVINTSSTSNIDE